jgi:phasin family protein
MADHNTDTATAPKADAPAAPKADSTPAPAARAAPKAAEAPKPAAKAAPAKAAAKPARARKAAAPKAKPVRKPVRAAAAAAKRTATVTQQIQIKGTRNMKNEANKIADRAQAVFGDINERARTQIERNTRLAEELTNLSKGNIEAVVASTKVAAKGLETIGQEVAEYSRKSFEDASAALKGFAEAKSATDFFRLQSDFARTQFDSLVAESSRLSETMLKLAGDVAQPLTNRASVAADKVKSAVAF